MDSASDSRSRNMHRSDLLEVSPCTKEQGQSFYRVVARQCVSCHLCHSGQATTGGRVLKTVKVVLNQRGRMGQREMLCGHDLQKHS